MRPCHLWPLPVLLLTLLPLGVRPVTAEDEAQPRWRQCYDAIAWHTAVEVPNTESRLLELVGKGRMAAFSKAWVRKAIKDAGGLVPALERAREEQKLVLWYVPHLEGQHMILPHLLDRYMTVGPLSHPDVTSVINRRFVSVKLPAGGELGKRYGLIAPAAMEPALLVLDAQGKVLGRTDRINVFDPVYVRGLLTQVLAREGVTCAHSAEYKQALERLAAGGDYDALTLDLAEQCLLDGDDGEAERALRSATRRYTLNGQRSTALRLDLARLRRERASDFHELFDPFRLPRGNGVVHEAWARLLLQQGNAGDARHWLLGLQRSVVTRSARIGYHLAVARYLLREDQRARETWQGVAAGKEDSIWAAKADAYARPGADTAHGEGPLTRGMLYLHAPRAAQTPDNRWIERVRAEGVGFLLQSQRADGGWEGARWGAGKEGSASRRGYGNIKLAISALCCAALRATPVEARSREIKKALERGEAQLLAEGRVARGEAIVWPYADAFRLLHFARHLDALPAHRQAAVRKRMQTWVRHLVEHQAENDGGFRHYTYRSTFVTACVTYCLWHANAAGVKVPASVFEAAAKTLEGARGGDLGLYGYLLDRPALTRTMKGATGRQPLCEWTLFLLGRRKTTDLADALEIFDEGYASFERARKGNFHIPALDNTAGYYFFHDFYPACEAARAGGEHTQPHVAGLLEKLRALQDADGTFLDCGFSYGKCYSTAMALLSLEALTRSP